MAHKYYAEIALPKLVSSVTKNLVFVPYLWCWMLKKQHVLLLQLQLLPGSRFWLP